MTGKRWTVFDRFVHPMTFHAWEVQEHCEPCRPFHQRTDCGAAEPKNKITFPIAGYRSFADLGRTIANHQRIC